MAVLQARHTTTSDQTLAILTVPNPFVPYEFALEEDEVRTPPNWVIMILTLIAFPFIAFGLTWWTVTVIRFLASVTL